MLHSVKDVQDFQVAARDGDVGSLEEFLFDDRDWRIRYLLVKSGGWATARKILVSPLAIKEIDWEDESLTLDLTFQQIQQCPPWEADKPVSRQYEAEFARHYGYSFYWNQPYLWGESALPDLMSTPGLDTDPTQGEPQGGGADHAHLRSSREVTGYDLRTTDNTIGHVEDFLFDDKSWILPLLVAETREWWPGKHVLIATSRIEDIDKNERCIALRLTREEMEHEPDYDLMSANPDGAVQDLYRRFWRSPYTP